MASTKSTVTIVFNHLPKLTRDMHERAVTVVKKTAFDIESTAKQLCPVDTGFLRNSIATVQPTELSAVIGPSAEYGIYVELGTVHMGPQPFMTPAAEQHRQSFMDAMKRVAG